LIPLKKSVALDMDRTRTFRDQNWLNSLITFKTFQCKAIKTRFFAGTRDNPSNAAIGTVVDDILSPSGIKAIPFLCPKKSIKEQFRQRISTSSSQDWTGGQRPSNVCVQFNPSLLQLAGNELKLQHHYLVFNQLKF
jgi:hypothetical protein